MASGEEAAELGDADSGLMWKPHNIEVTSIIIINIKNNFEVIFNIIINIIDFEVAFNQRCKTRKSFLVVSNFRCFCANSRPFTLIFGVYLLIGNVVVLIFVIQKVC